MTTECKENIEPELKTGRESGKFVDPNAPEFVEGWSMVQTLGEGAFGEVKLLINSDNGEAVALKMVDLSRHPDAENCVQKEMLIHKMLRHPNIIKFFGLRREECMQYMFLEYAVGGELFDRIEPDKGMPPYLAKKYFRELIAGMSYLHSKGVTHRDIKPENLLLDASDSLKISDFGMATLFKHNGRERVLNRRCGTRPYMSPEVLNGEDYYAQPADIWSCGIVLVTLLAGELPWDAPCLGLKEYTQWLRKDSSAFDMAPWPKISAVSLSFLRLILRSDPSKRLTVTTIRDHAWFKTSEPDVYYSESDIVSGPSVPPPSKRLCSDLPDDAPSPSLLNFSVGVPAPEQEDDVGTRRLTCSQPNTYSSNLLKGSLPSAEVDIDTDKIFFSQPAKTDQLLLSASLSDRNLSPLQKLVKRMTRMVVTTTITETVTQLNTLFTTLLYTTSVVSVNPNIVILTVNTVDRRGAPLVMKASLYNMGKNVLVDFRLSKGCGLDFKRQFVRIKTGLSNIILPGVVDWNDFVKR